MANNYEWQKPNRNKTKEQLQQKKNHIDLQNYMRYQQKEDMKVWLESKRKSKLYEESRLKQIPKQYLLSVKKNTKEQEIQQSERLWGSRSRLENNGKQDDKKIKENPALVRKIKQFQLKCLQKDNVIKTILSQNSNLHYQIQQLKKENKQISAYCYRVKQQLRRVHAQRRDQGQVVHHIQYEDYQNLSDFAKKTSQWLPSDRNELSNRIKLQKFQNQYLNYQKRSEKTILQFQQTIVKKELQIQDLQKQIRILEGNLQKVMELKNMERTENMKRKKIIENYEIEISELIQHNKKISEELEKYYRNHKQNQKIGFIINPKEERKK